MLSMFFQVSPGGKLTGPDPLVGQAPVRAWKESTQTKICSTVRGGRPWGLRTPRHSESNCAKDEPPGSPRLPLRSALSTAYHVSPRAPAILPLVRSGHVLVRL